MITKLKVVLLGRPTRYSLGFKVINLCEAFYIKFSTSILVLRREMLKLIWNNLNLFFMCYVIEYMLKLFGKSLAHPNPWSIPFLCLLRTDYTLNSSNPFSCVNKAAEISHPPSPICVCFSNKKKIKKGNRKLCLGPV